MNPCPREYLMSALLLLVLPVLPWWPVPVARAAEEPAVVKAEAKALLGAIEERFLALDHLAYVAERTSQKGRQKQTETWSFVYRKPDDVRIELLGSQARVITLNRTNLWEFIPSVRKAMRTDLSSLSDAERTKRMMQVISRVAIDGMHPGDVDSLCTNLARREPVAGLEHTVRFVGEDPDVTVEVNTQRMYMVSSEINNNDDELVLRTRVMDVVEVAPGYWFPVHLELVHRDGKEFIRSTVRLRNVTVNGRPDDGLFQFTPSPGVEVISPR